MATTAGASRRLDALGKARRRERIFASLRLGSSTGDIAREEKLTARRVRQIVSEALARRPVDEARDHALLQLARLEPAIKLLAGEVAQGDVGAISPYLELLDRLDRHQVAAAGARLAYDDRARQRLLAKINRLVAREERKRARRAARGASAPAGAGGEAQERGLAAEEPGPHA